MIDAELPALDVPLLPQHFRGRRSVLDPICDRLRQPELLSSQVVGGPHSGKTSLLRFLASERADAVLGRVAPMVRVYVDAAALGAKATPVQFWMLVCREIKAVPAAATLLVQHAALATALDQALARADSGALDIFDLQDLFDGFAAVQRLVVLLVDEFDTVIANPHFLPPAEFFHQVRNLCNRAPRGAAFVASTRRPLSDVGAAAAGPSPPYNHFGTIPLDPLSDHDIRDQLVWLAHCRGVLLPEDAWRPVARVSGGQPMLASHLMRQVVDALADGRSVDDAERSALIADPDGPYARLNQSILAALTARERQAVQAWLADPVAVTEPQRALLQRLRKFALLPPGIEI
ncbi:MAG: hypothetical protein ACRESW_05670 [Nevskiales bacterium]